jgi:GGDEF domain-containing protein
MQDLFANPVLNVLTNTGQVARISNETFVSLMNAAAEAVNAIKTDALREAADEMRAAVDFDNLTADQQSGVVLALGELHRRAAALRSAQEASDAE